MLFYEGLINCNVYQKVLGMIKSNMNGRWMFGQNKGGK